jgi:hypothetical protein
VQLETKGAKAKVGFVTLPYGGMTRIRFKGYFSPASPDPQRNSKPTRIPFPMQQKTRRSRRQLIVLDTLFLQAEASCTIGLFLLTASTIDPLRYRETLD